MKLAAEPRTATQILGTFVAETRFEDLAPAQIDASKCAILNFIGCALAVANDPTVSSAITVLAPHSGPERASIIGRSEDLGIVDAAFVNAVAGNLLDFDDTHLNTVIHPSAPVVPPVLALAQARGLSGQAVLLAFALGAEVECRIGNAVSPSHYARGWHITATCGVFGASAATAKLLGLDASQTAHALAIAASQSAGLVENLTAAAKNVSVGNAAKNGIVSALFAQAGYAGATTSLEGPLGWARACGDTFERSAIETALGTSWELERNTYKPYPCGIVLHAVIDACLAIAADHAIEAATIANINVIGDALLLARGDRPVHDERDARVSLHHVAAVAFLYGKAGIEEFTPALVHKPEVVALRSKVQAVLDQQLQIGAARVEVHLADGTIHTRELVHAKGSIEQPLSMAELQAKVRTLTAYGGSNCDADRVIDAATHLETAQTTEQLILATRPRAN